MQLSELIDGLELSGSNRDVFHGIEVSKVVYDSRKAEKGCVFVAIKGFTSDGHDYVDKAIENGASVIVVEEWPHKMFGDDVTLIEVKDSKKALAVLSSNFYSRPSEKMNLIGVTGTNGKTSVTYIIKSILDEAGIGTGLIGTIECLSGNQRLKTSHTTPLAPELNQYFDQMVRDKCTKCVMEVSSHAIELDRVYNLDFSTGIFTNLSVDHLDLHKNMENYFNVKKRLFETTRMNVVNISDAYGRRLYKDLKARNKSVMTYGFTEEADVYPSEIDYQQKFTLFTVNTPVGSRKVKLSIPGDIYVQNTLAGIACVLAENIGLDLIVKGVEKLKGVRGRFEVLPLNTGFDVIIDYAHTGDGLEKTLNTIKSFAKARIITLFGVGGGSRGEERRYDMGHISGRLSDFTIISSDNPRNVDPQVIASQIASAVEAENGAYAIIIDRKEAIEYAVAHAQAGDIILLAGKGHETTQITNEGTIEFDEREIVFEAVRNL